MMKHADVLPHLIARRAEETPHRPFLTDAAGGSVTYAELDALARRWARGLARLGLRAGDRAVTMVEPSIAGTAMWLGLCWLGAVPVAVNPALRGRPLDRVLDCAGAQMILVGKSDMPVVTELRSRIGPPVYVCGADAEPSLILGMATPAPSGPAPGLIDPGPQSVATVLFTSGTTGASKSVAVRWAQLHAASSGHIPLARLTAEDVWYSPFPTYHVGGLFPIYAMAMSGGRVVLRERFRTPLFWEDVRKHGCTATLMFGATVAFLLDQPSRPDDADNPLRQVIGYFHRSKDFVQRFGIEHHYRAYNQTEMSVPIATGLDEPPDTTTCGRLRQGYEARLVTPDGDLLEGAGVGEFVVRSTDPSALAAGYLGDPEASAQLWRGGWLHSGDALRRDADGWYYFVDRLHDFIRRRGENVSAAEVETEALAHPGVAEVAVIGVPAGDGDQEIKMIAVAGAQRVAEAELGDWLAERLPAFMVPRYIEYVDRLPRTDTEKVRKSDLRASPVNSHTWDRRLGEFAGAETVRVQT